MDRKTVYIWTAPKESGCKYVTVDQAGNMLQAWGKLAADLFRATHSS